MVRRRTGCDLLLAAAFAVAWVLVLVAFAKPGIDTRTELEGLIGRVEQRMKVPFVRERALWGELRDGTANEHCRRAAEGMHRIQCRTNSSRADLLPVLAAMRAGAECREVARDQGWPRVLPGPVVWAECDRLLGEGDASPAVRTWLDTAALGLAGDIVATTPFDIGWDANMLRGLASAWSPERLDQLSASARAELAAGIAGIDELLSRQNDVERFLATFARNVTSDTFYPQDPWQWFMSWESAVSPQQRWIDATAMAARGLGTLVPAATGWQARRAQIVCVRRDHVCRQQDEVFDLGQWFEFVEHTRRHALAEVRILGAVLQLLAGGEPAAAANPLGDGTIEVERRADCTLLRCVGPPHERVERVVPR
jgi:hypothetical protein